MAAHSKLFTIDQGDIRERVIVAFLCSFISQGLQKQQLLSLLLPFSGVEAVGWGHPQWEGKLHTWGGVGPTSGLVSVCKRNYYVDSKDGLQHLLSGAPFTSNISRKHLTPFETHNIPIFQEGPGNDSDWSTRPG